MTPGPGSSPFPRNSSEWGAEPPSKNEAMVDHIHEVNRRGGVCRADGCDVSDPDDLHPLGPRGLLCSDHRAEEARNAAYRRRELEAKMKRYYQNEDR